MTMTHPAQQLLREADFIERYTRYYRRHFTAAMQRSAIKSDADSMRLVRMCLEALDMITDSKQTLVAAASQMRN